MSVVLVAILVVLSEMPDSAVETRDVSALAALWIVLIAPVLLVTAVCSVAVVLFAAAMSAVCCVAMFCSWVELLSSAEVRDVRLATLVVDAEIAPVSAVATLSFELVVSIASDAVSTASEITPEVTFNGAAPVNAVLAPSVPPPTPSLFVMLMTVPNPPKFPVKLREAIVVQAITLMRAQRSSV
jgi:hypothetical protein